MNGPTTQIEERGRCEKIQGDARVIVTIVDTPGFGDSLDNNDRFIPVETYIEQQNKMYEDNEAYRRPNQQQDDSRIHACFYFIMPHRVTPLDCEFMRRLQTKVPIIPIVAKADTLTMVELEDQLGTIRSRLEEHSIRIFDFGERNIDESWMKDDTTTMDDPSTFSQIGKALVMDDAHQTVTPLKRRQLANVFAVISGSRQYMWGTACEEDPQHSDTPRLHNVLFQDRSLQSLGKLHDRANEIHEAWRQSENLRLREAMELEEERLRCDFASLSQAHIELQKKTKVMIRSAIGFVVTSFVLWWVGSSRLFSLPLLSSEHDCKPVDSYSNQYLFLHSSRH